MNTATINTLKQVFPTPIDVTCLSHTLDRAGQYFTIPNAIEFVNAWVSLFSHSFKARLAFREQTRFKVKLLSKTRWWSRWEVMKQLVELFPDVHGFASSQSDISPSTVRKLLGLLDAPQLRSLIQLELPAVVDASEVIVKSPTTSRVMGRCPLWLTR